MMRPAVCESEVCFPSSRFTGKERDAESGNDYFESRYYASAMGRFMSPDDPFVGQHESDPQSWNLYAYARNNPLTNTDPDGHDCVNGSNASNGTVSYISTSNAADCGKGFTYVNGTVDPNSFTYSNGQLGFNISNYADGSGIAASVTMASGSQLDPDTLKAGVFGSPSASIWRNANGVVTAAAAAELTVASVVMPEILLEDTEILSLGLSKTAAQSLEKLAGLGRAEARAALEKAGFKQRGVTKGGYENWVHPDGSRVSIGPDGGVDRIPPASAGKGFRYDSDTGNIRRPHNVAEEKVE
jgi:RHS repeat-associated protein